MPLEVKTAAEKAALKAAAKPAPKPEQHFTPGTRPQRQRRNDAEAQEQVRDLFLNGPDTRNTPDVPDAGAGEKPKREVNTSDHGERAAQDADPDADLYGDGKPVGAQPAGDAEEDGGEAPKKGAKPKTFSEAAEALGMEPKDLYALTLNTGDGEEVKIGDLKDAYQNRQAAERETAERAAALDERETALFQEQRLFAELGDDLAKHISPQKRQEMLTHLQEREARERQRLMQMMPELQDQATFEQFRDDVVGTLGKYGYKPHEIVVSDHRHLLVVRDLIRANKRIKSLLQLPKEGSKPPKASPPQGRGAGSQNRRGSKPSRPARGSEQVEAVSALIKGN